LFLLGLAVYLAQVVDGILLIARPHSQAMVYVLTYTLFGALAASLSRAWALLQPSVGVSPQASSS
jgi:hypothetical protein